MEGVAPAVGEKPQPVWGLLGTLGWSVLAVIGGMTVAASSAFVVARLDPTGSDVGRLMRDGNPAGSALVIVGFLVASALLFLAARLSGGSALSYLALTFPRGRYVLAGSIGLAMSLLYLYGFVLRFEINPSTVDAQGLKNARSLGAVSLYVLMTVLVAPLFEELLARGFLYRGLAASRIGAAGAVVLPSAVWALMHVERGLVGAALLMIPGLIYGGLRWWTGSLLVPLACHVAKNALGIVLILVIL